MEIHINQIPAEGLHLEGEVQEDILQLPPEDFYRHANSLFYSLDIGLSDGGLFATGNLSTRVDLKCVKCLEWFNHPVRIDNFALQIDLEGNETVDLTPQLREDILLALPNYPHCDRDGDRACPMQNKLDETSGDEEGSGKADHTWDALDQLNVENKN